MKIAWAHVEPGMSANMDWEIAKVVHRDNDVLVWWKNRWNGNQNRNNPFLYSRKELWQYAAYMNGKALA